jgi:hypothetical protein
VVTYEEKFTIFIFRIGITINFCNERIHRFIMILPNSQKLTFYTIFLTDSLLFTVDHTSLGALANLSLALDSVFESVISKYSEKKSKEKQKRKDSSTSDSADRSNQKYEKKEKKSKHKQKEGGRTSRKTKVNRRGKMGCDSLFCAYFRHVHIYLSFCEAWLDAAHPPLSSSTVTKHHTTHSTSSSDQTKSSVETPCFSVHLGKIETASQKSKLIKSLRHCVRLISTLPTITLPTSTGLSVIIHDIHTCGIEADSVRDEWGRRIVTSYFKLQSIGNDGWSQLQSRVKNLEKYIFFRGLLHDIRYGKYLFIYIFLFVFCFLFFVICLFL